MKKINSILTEVLGKIEPTKEEVNIIEESLKKFVTLIGSNIKKSGKNIEIFVGGSFAKNTLIRKDYYDIDIFLRFEKGSDEEISALTKKFLEGLRNVELIHGSRDYFRVKINSILFIELVPVIKVKNPSESENITDLSYSHVKYINKKIKSKKVLNDIKLAKAFCYATHSYGAESYIKGFSGYALELLVYHYGGFLKFIKTMSKIKDKEIIDIERHFKRKSDVLLDLNGSKLNSPIVLIDPTHKQRNALAALSSETFLKFQESCKSFLKNPNVHFFELQKTDLDNIKLEARRKKYEFILLEAKTNKQVGDVAGSKLLKFYNHFEQELSKLFDIKDKGFNYNGKKAARYFFVVKSKKELLFSGPKMADKVNLEKFERIHKNYFTKKGRVYAKEPIQFDVKDFLNKWKIKNRQRIKEMYITSLRIID